MFIVLYVLTNFLLGCATHHTFHYRLLCYTVHDIPIIMYCVQSVTRFNLTYKGKEGGEKEEGGREGGGGGTRKETKN